MFRILSLGWAVCWLGTAAQADFIFQHGVHTYEVVTSGATWTAAAADAASRTVAGAQGYLAEVDDAAENTAIFNQLTANLTPGQVSATVAPDGGGASYVWLGATDRNAEGTWIWDGRNTGSGTTIGTGQGAAGLGNWASAPGIYNNWGSGFFVGGLQAEPDDFNASQDAAGIALTGWPSAQPGGLGSAGQWNDVDEGNSLYYVIEYNAVIPEPATALLTLAGLAVAGAMRRRKGTVARPHAT
jgi:hypothetical protein